MTSLKVALVQKSAAPNQKKRKSPTNAAIYQGSRRHGCRLGAVSGNVV